MDNYPWGLDPSVIHGTLLHPKTSITTTQDGTQEFDIVGNWPSIWMLDNGFFSEESLRWIKTITSCVVGEHVTSIGNGLFAANRTVESVSIPDSVTAIGSSAFEAARSLRSLVIPSSVQSIGAYCFTGCNSLESVTFMGKTLEQVQAMDNYPWGITDTSIIHAG